MSRLWASRTRTSSGVQQPIRSVGCRSARFGWLTQIDIPEPLTIQNLIATAISLFRALFNETTEELYVKTNDFGLEWPVEVLPDVWEMQEVQGFLRTVEFHARPQGEGNVT